MTPEDRYCAIVERFEGAATAPARPAFAKGRRWPKAPARRAAILFRLVVSYWRITGEAVQSPDTPDMDAQARAVRRKTEGAELSAAELRALAQQPLRPMRPQQPLDVGLFEAPAPEAPHILIPDE